MEQEGAIRPWFAVFISFDHVPLTQVKMKVAFVAPSGRSHLIRWALPTGKEWPLSLSLCPRRFCVNLGKDAT